MSEAFQPLTGGELPGIILIFLIALFSAIALVFVAGRIIYFALCCILGFHKPSREYVFFHTQLGSYAACLLASNFLDSVAGLITASFIREQGIREGPSCTAQAVLMQIGNFATAFFTVVIAVHTFTTLVLHSRSKVWICATVIVVGWVSSILIGVVPLAIPEPGSGPIYGNDGFACGVRRVYPVPQFLFHLLPIFCAAIVSAILYSLIFLVLRGTLVFRGGVKIHLDPQQRWSCRVGTEEEYHRFISAIARSMLWYPFAYVVLLMPYSITRLLDISGFTVVFGTNVFAYMCTFVLGLVNVLLLYNTFRVLGPAFGGFPAACSSSDIESFTSDDEKPRFFTRSMTATRKGVPTLDKSSANIGPYRFPSSNTRTREVTHKRSVSTLGRFPLIPAREGFHTHAMSTDSAQTSVSVESLQRAITPMSDFNRRLVATPQPVLQGNGLRTLRLSVDDVRSPPSAFRQSPRGLPPPPRATRSPVRRRPTLDSVYTPREATGFIQNMASPPHGIRAHPSLSAVSSRAPSPPSPHASSPSDYGASSPIPPTPPLTARSYVRGLPNIPTDASGPSIQLSRQSIRYYR